MRPSGPSARTDLASTELCWQRPRRRAGGWTGRPRKRQSAGARLPRSRQDALAVILTTACARAAYRSTSEKQGREAAKGPPHASSAEPHTRAAEELKEAYGPGQP